MGEAKRRNAMAKQVADDLRRRLDAGEFGSPGKAEHYCLVLDKSSRGRDLLATLRTLSAFAGLEPLIEAEAFRVWEASKLFRFVVLCAGEGKPDQRSLLAADLGRLLGDTLPKALRRLPPGTPPSAVLLGVAEEDLRAIERGVAEARPS
ncbi:hypothetical protein [Caldimonas brevitalea]|nr:hypothetical protein [Caldimonas brevitalea]